MNQQISVQDERIDQQISVAKENIKVAITQSAPQTFQVWENEQVKDVVLQVMQPPMQTTLKDCDNDISNLESNVASTNNQLLQLNAELEEKKKIRDELEKVVAPVFELNQTAVAEKQTEEKPKEPIIEPLPVDDKPITP